MSALKSFLPKLTELDPKITSEGTLDPLGLYSIADALASLLVPGVRERQSHPRYLTAIAVGLELTKSFPDGMVSADGVSEPWQVYEWHMVQGLVDRLKDEHASELRGLPGQDKVKKTLEEGVPLSANRYLKTPGTFGFHGVYRVLARDLKIEQGGMSGETGIHLVETWAKEQGLEGFTGASEGPGRRIREDLINAIKESLELGAVAKKRNWHRWDFFGEHLSPYRIGKKEAEVIHRGIVDSSVPLRRMVTDFLSTTDGQKAWNKSDSERLFHRELAKKAGVDLLPLLKAIEKYENFSRLLQDAFDACLTHLSQTPGCVSCTELAKIDGIEKNAKQISEIYAEVADLLNVYKLTTRFEASFQGFQSFSSTSGWINDLMEHHRKIQERKPPNGKGSWVIKSAKSEYMVRTQYRKLDVFKFSEEYAHAYRTRPLWSFLKDLKRVSE